MTLPLLFLLAQTSSAQNPGPPPKMPSVPRLAPIPAPAKGGWTSLKIDPLAVARRADARLAGLKNAISETLTVLNLPSGRGMIGTRSVIQTPALFRIEAMQISGALTRPAFVSAVYQAQNGALRALTERGWVAKGAPSAYGTLPKPLLGAFLLTPDEIVYRGVGGGRPLARLVAEARKAGWRVSADRRVSPGRGPTAGAETRLMVRSPDGSRAYAVHISERQGLPTQIETQGPVAKDGVKGPVRIRWKCVWGLKGSALTAEDMRSFHPGAGIKP